MEEENKKRLRWRWVYIPYFPYIFLMALAYFIGVWIAMFQAFAMFWYDRDEYYPTFIANEKFLRDIFTSMWDN